MRTRVKQGFFVIAFENVFKCDQAQDYARKRQLNQTVSRIRRLVELTSANTLRMPIFANAATDIAELPVPSAPTGNF